MTRTFRTAVLSGILVVVGLALPSIAEAQRGGGGGGRGGGAVARGGPARGGGGAVVRGGGSHGGGQVAVPRRYPPYSSPYYRSYYSGGYYSHPYYYRPYYSGYYPYYYSPWSFSLSFGWYGGGWYPPSYAYPYYYPYPSPYPAYPYPVASEPPYSGVVSTDTPYGSQSQERTPVARADERGAFGTLSIRVTPSDATIVIDRQGWDRPRGDERFSIELAEGPHQVEIRKAGYSTYIRTIDVPRAQTTVLNVALTSGAGGTLQVARTVPFRQ